MPDSHQKPSMGRIVTFRNQVPCKRQAVGWSEPQRPTDNPAIVTRVWSDTCVNLKVLPDCAAPFDVTSQMLIDPEDQAAHGWFWPPRV